MAATADLLDKLTTNWRAEMRENIISFAAVIAKDCSPRQSHSINKGWIIGLDAADFSTTKQL
jgi:hypothetical protein